eukprot:3318679-Rhodomonas_salina.2
MEGRAYLVPVSRSIQSRFGTEIRTTTREREKRLPLSSLSPNSCGAALLLWECLGLSFGGRIGFGKPAPSENRRSWGGNTGQQQQGTQWDVAE